MTIQKQFRGGYQLSCVDFDFFELNFGAVEEGAPPALWLTKFITEMSGFGCGSLVFIYVIKRVCKKLCKLYTNPTFKPASR